MYLRMVFLICLLAVCFGSFNELNADRYKSNSCFRIYCDLKNKDISCEKLNTTEIIEWYDKSRFPDNKIKLGEPCEYAIPVNTSELFFEVNEARLNI